MFKFLKNLLGRLFPCLRKKTAPAAPPAKKKTWWDKFLEKYPGARLIRTSKGGRNFPQRQPCPSCGHWAPRKEKSLGGASFSCRCPVGIFFVRQP